MSTLGEEELQVLYDNLLQIRLVNNVALSCAAFVTYDILTNLDKEITFIWRYYPHTDNGGHTSWHHRARHILVQTLFVFGRYYALLYLVGFFAVNNHQGLSIPFCKVYFYYFIFGGELLYTTLVNVILVIRLNAMYQILHGTQGLRKHQVFLASVAISQFVSELVTGTIAAKWMEERVVEPPAGLPWPGCVISEGVHDALTLPAWITAILAATVFLVLTLRLLHLRLKMRFRRFRDFTISNIKGELRNIQPMTLTLVRDSVLFYFPMFGILVASVPLMIVYNTEIATVTVPIILALYSFCASRLIIHTRESFAQSSHGAPSQDFESIGFASQSLTAPRAVVRVADGSASTLGTVKHFVGVTCYSTAGM